MDWNKPYHDVSGFNSEHGRMFGSKSVESAPVKQVKQSEGSLVSRLKKPFMPKTWKWMRTSGEAKVFTYQPRMAETTSLSLNIPKQFKPYIRNAAGETFVGTTIKMDDASFLELGRRVVVSMEDAETKAKLSATFPSLEFKVSQEEGGETYRLDWEAFARDRKVAKGAWDEDWGYSKSGNPTLGQVSMYDKTLKLNWNSQLHWIWWLVGALGLLGLGRLFFRK